MRGAVLYGPRDVRIDERPTATASAQARAGTGTGPSSARAYGFASATGRMAPKATSIGEIAGLIHAAGVPSRRFRR
jgi:hypothetical protein